jgi:hypothetical protein
MPRDLTGLAALGALGMMLANKRKGDPSNVQDTNMLPSTPPPKPLAGSDAPDTEFGDLAGAQDAASSRAVMDQFNANEQGNKPSPASMAKVQSAVRNPTGMAGQKVRGGNGPDQIPSGEPDSSAGTESDFAPSMKINKPSSRIGDYLKDLTTKEEKHGTYRDLSTGKIVRYAKGGATGKVVKMAKGGVTSSASSRADGIASKGKTRGKIC